MRFDDARLRIWAHGTSLKLIPSHKAVQVHLKGGLLRDAFSTRQRSRKSQMDRLKSVWNSRSLHKRKKWTREQSIKLLRDIHIDHHSPNYKAIGQTQADGECHYGDIFWCLWTAMKQKYPTYDIVDVYYKSEEAMNSIDCGTTSSLESQRTWSKEKTRALFDAVKEHGTYHADEQRFRHYYDVVAIMFRDQVHSRNLEEGIVKAVDDFYRAGCPKASSMESNHGG